jgi:hypothetical protein
MRETFAAYDLGDFEKAKAIADKCIREFAQEAARQQDRLIAAGTQPPPDWGQGEEAAREVFKNGLINDVAACAWLAGRCAENLKQVEEARREYKLAATFTYARCWDPATKTFWHTAQKAGDDLKNLDKVDM